MADKPTPTETWLALTKVPRPSKVVDLPRVNPETGKPVGQIRIWPLTQEEQHVCNAEADRYTKTLMKESQRKDEVNFGYEHTYGNEGAVQLLFRACRDAKDPSRPAFPSTVAIRRELSADEVSSLFNMYLTVCAEIGPVIHRLSDEELEALVRRIQEGGSAFPFFMHSLEKQTTLLLFMASQLVSFWTDTSSAGSPPGELQPSESEPDPVGGPDDLEPVPAPEE